jgi:MFS family permease
MAPRDERARYTSLIFFFSALGAVAGIWLGLWLTTPPTPLPLGLPFALAGANLEYGWRIMYAIGGLLAVIGIMLRVQLPESPPWLITQGRIEEAHQVVRMMEAIAKARGPLKPIERGERLERKAWLPIAAIITLIGGVIVAEAGDVVWASVIGSIIVFFGFNLWIPIAYSWSTKHYPTRARTTSRMGSAISVVGSDCC